MTYATEGPVHNEISRHTLTSQCLRLPLPWHRARALGTAAKLWKHIRAMRVRVHLTYLLVVCLSRLCQRLALVLRRGWCWRLHFELAHCWVVAH